MQKIINIYQLFQKIFDKVKNTGYSPDNFWLYSTQITQSMSNRRYKSISFVPTSQ